MSGTDSEEQQPKQTKRINLTAVVAGALASLSAAVVASYFGVAGTLIGTAVVSIVSSLAAAFYAGLLGATRGLVQRTTTVARAPRDRDGAPRDDQARLGDPASAGNPGASPRPGSQGERPAGGARAWSPSRRWLAIGGLAMVIFAIAIGALTGVEAAIKEPLASALGVRDRGQARTSVGVAVDRAGGGSTPRSSPSSSSSTAPAAPPGSGGQPGQAPTTEPGPPDTGQGPSTTGSTGGSAPTTTTPPTSQPPAPSTGATTSGGG
jgi:hypothetical protein